MLIVEKNCLYFNAIALNVKTIKDMEMIEDAIFTLRALQHHFDIPNIEKEIAYLRDGQQVLLGDLRGRKHPIP